MHIKVLGSAAAEGWPALFCECEYCKNAKRIGGKNLRSRTSYLINGKLLVDIGPDIYLHDTRYGFFTHNLAHFCSEEDQEGLPCRSVGLFNLEDDKRIITFSVADLKLPKADYILTDVRSGETFELKDEFSVEVMPHGSRLFAVSKKDKFQLLDADIRVLCSERNGDTLKLNFDYAAEGTFQFSSMPYALKINEKAVDVVKLDARTIKVQVPANADMEIS